MTGLHAFLERLNVMREISEKGGGNDRKLYTRECVLNENT